MNFEVTPTLAGATVTFWLYMTNNSNQMLPFRLFGVGEPFKNELYVSVSSGSLKVYCRDANSKNLFIDSYYAFLKDKWYFCALVLPLAKSGSSPTNRIYVGTNISDFSLVASATNSLFTTMTCHTLSIGAPDKSFGYNSFTGYIQDFRIFNLDLAVTELKTLCLKRMPLKLSSLYSKWSDPSSLITFNYTHNDIVSKNFVVNNAPTVIYNNAVPSSNLRYASTGLKLMQGSMVANLANNSLNVFDVPQTFVSYAVNSPYLSAPATIMFWARMPSGTLTNASSTNAATILTLSHGTGDDADPRLQVHMTSTSEIWTEWYPYTGTSGSISGLTPDTWFCFGLTLIDTTPWSAKLFYAADGSTQFVSDAGVSATQTSSGTTTPFTEMLIGRKYGTNSGGFPGQISNFRVYQGKVGSFVLSAYGVPQSDFPIHVLNKKA